jgi:hypothetical protein
MKLVSRIQIALERNRQLSSEEIELISNFLSKMNKAKLLRLDYVLENNRDLVEDVLSFILKFSQVEDVNLISEKFEQAVDIIESDKDKNNQDSEEDAKQKTELKNKKINSQKIKLEEIRKKLSQL